MIRYLRWFKRLFEDVNGFPSSRLCISWIFAFAVVYYLETLDEAKLAIMVTAITTMTSLSVVEKVKNIIKEDKE